MKKILLILLCVAIMLPSMIIASADIDATLTIGTVEGPFKKGDEIAIPVTITEWANAYATFELEFDFDETLLKLDAIETSEDDFSGAMGVGNHETNLFVLVCNPTSERQANKLLGGEVCVLYFIANTNIDKSTTVTAIAAAVDGYAKGKEDNWIETQTLELKIANGGVNVKPIENDTSSTTQNNAATSSIVEVSSTVSDTSSVVEVSSTVSNTPSKDETSIAVNNTPSEDETSSVVSDTSSTDETSSVVSDTSSVITPTDILTSTDAAQPTQSKTDTNNKRNNTILLIASAILIIVIAVIAILLALIKNKRSLLKEDIMTDVITDNAESEFLIQTISDDELSSEINESND